MWGATPKVKNTFVEFPLPEHEHEGRGRRTRSDMVSSKTGDAYSSPLVVAKSPTGSPSLGPADQSMQAVPIDEINFEMLEEAAPVGSYQAHSKPGLGKGEPAYVVPTTPSPFLHSAFPPSVVPPFGGFGGFGELALPPAYEPGQSPDGGEYGTQDADGNFIQGMPFMPPEMFDPNYQQYMQYAWDGNMVEGAAFGQGGQGLGEQQMTGLDGQAGADPDGFADIGFGEVGLAEPGYGDAVGDGFPNGDQGGEARAAEASATTSTEKKESRRKRNREKKAAAAAAAAAAEEGGFKETSSPSAGAAAKGSDEKGVQKSGKGGGGEAEPEKRELKGDITDTPSIYTTVMLRNIPNKYTREMLVNQLSVEFKGLFDFMYLPIDFKNKCNVGYGFINFRTTDACDEFVRQFHNVDVRKCLPGLNSKKVVEVTPARVQGLIENVRRLRNSPVMNQLQDHPEWMPLLFNEDGVEEPFPNPDQPLPPVKPRGRAREGKKGEDGDA